MDLFDFPDELNENDMMNLDKAWHAIHFILSDKAWETSKEPILKMVLSGNELGEDTDNGYGPATYLTPREVKEISKAAQDINEEWFRERFDITKMKENEIYLIASVEDTEEGLFEYVWSNFNEAREFFKRAASEKLYIVFSVC